VVSGMLLGRRLQGRLGDSVGASSIGDGGTSTGAFHEGLNMAAVEKLPVIVSVANNQYAYSTPTDRQYACESLLSRAQGYGIEGYAVDGTDLAACISVFQYAVARARAGHGPQMVVGSLLRLSGHGEHDDASYIPDTTKKQGKDCIVLAEQVLHAQGWMSPAEVSTLRAEIQDDVEKIITQTSREPAPDPFRETWQALSTPGLAEGWEVH
jgi:TPP-dependent pyruvate/acetoin dehydrogenase alpha subunit